MAESRTQILEREIASLSETTAGLKKQIAEQGQDSMFQGVTAQGAFEDIQKRISSRQTELDQEKRAQQTAESRIQTGLELGKEIVKTGSLGRAKTSTELQRVDTGTVRQGRSSDIADIIAKRREALGGFTGEEQQAQRDIASEQIGRQTETQRRRLQAIQSQQGVRGGTAASQQLDVLTQGVRSRAEFERDLFLENTRMKREALSAFENSVTGAERNEAERQLAKADLLKFNVGQQAREQQLQAEQERFNLQQAANEKQAQMGVGFGFASLVAGDTSSDRAVAAQHAATAAAGSGSK